MLLSLQKPEESVRRPQAIDDEFLLWETDDNVRVELAEITPKTIVGTVNALASQVRQMNWGTLAGKRWPHTPPISMQEIYDILYNLGATIWTAAEPITAGQVVYATSTAQQVRVAAKDIPDSLSIIGIAKDTVSTGANLRVLHSGNIMIGFTGLDVGRIYYIGPNGGISLVPADGSGELVLKIGIARTSSELLIDIGEPRFRA